MAYLHSVDYVDDRSPGTGGIIVIRKRVLLIEFLKSKKLCLLLGPER
jgi:hypothetical protein